MPHLTADHIEKLIAKNEEKKVKLELKFEDLADSFTRKQSKNIERVLMARNEINDLKADIEIQDELVEAGAISQQEKDEAIRPLNEKKTKVEEDGGEDDARFERERLKADRELNEILAETRRVEYKIESYREMLAVMDVAVDVQPKTTP